MSQPQLLRPEEVQAALGLGRSKTYELIGRGELPVIRFGRAVRVPAEALADWIAEHTEVPVEGRRAGR